MKSFATAVLSLLLLSGVPAQAATDGYELQIFSAQGELVRSFVPFSEGAPGSLTAGDLGTDGVAEILVGAGTNLKPLVRVFRQDGSQIGEFLAYSEGFHGGVNVASCDLDGDGESEIVTGAGYSGGPHIRVFTREGIATPTSFFAYDPAFRGGVNVACGDVTGDGQAEIITGAGITGGPHIRVFDAQGNLLDEAFSGSASDKTGAFITLGDTNSDGQLEVIASPMGYAHPHVTIFDWTINGLKYRQVLAVNETPTHGTPISAFDSNTDGTAEIVISQGAFGSGDLKLLTTVGSVTQTIATEINTASAAILTAPLHDTQNNLLLVLASATQLVNNAAEQYILVDLSEQKLTAYSNGVPINSFLVSTGLPGYSTPEGSTTVTAKIPVMDYVWSYGDNDHRNYNIPNVKWNLRFRDHHYIHSAYWHNNFGHRMSHGCVNTSVSDAEWIYTWANVGTMVTIQK